MQRGPEGRRFLALQPCWNHIGFVAEPWWNRGGSIVEPWWNRLQFWWNLGSVVVWHYVFLDIPRVRDPDRLGPI